jgi:hypothetical protein
MTDSKPIMRTPAEGLLHAIARVTEIRDRAALDGPIASGAGAIALGEIEELATLALILMKNLTGQFRAEQ